MIRYLLHVSYMGTSFRGVTFIEPYYNYRDMRTVQGVLENAVKFLFKKRCEVSCSSRTDARVHGLHSTFHVDVEHEGRLDDVALSDTVKSQIISTLNDSLKVAKAAIRVNEVEIVDETNFMAYRNVKDRSYLYRIAVKPNAKTDEFNIPIEEIDRCFFIESDQFDIDKLKRATQMFVGRHDFRSFMRYSKEEKTKAPCYAQRKMYSITVEESRPCVISPHLKMCEDQYKFYDIKFTANSYVYRQIRRMIGALCAVAEGRITERDIYEMLTIPSFKMWHSYKNEDLIRTAPGCALYFVGITYKPEQDRRLGPPNLTVRGHRIKSFFD